MSLPPQLDDLAQGQFFAQLQSLRLPPLHGKRVLDFDCKDGYLCGFALHEGAESVTGVHADKAALKKAEHLFPDARFYTRQEFDQGRPEVNAFDVIILRSASCFGEQQLQVISRLMSLLDNDGVLVVELGLVGDAKNRWVSGELAGVSTVFPSRQKFKAEFEHYAWKVIGPAISTDASVELMVLHVRPLKPYVWLLLQESGSGKSTLTRRMFGDGHDVSIVSGDRTYLEITQGKHGVSEDLRAVVADEFSVLRISKTTHRILSEGYLPELAELWASLAGFNDFVLDTYMPVAYRQELKDLLAELGYFPVEMCLSADGVLPGRAKLARRVKGFRKSLLNNRPNVGHQLLDDEYCTGIAVMDLPADIRGKLRWHLDSPQDATKLTESQWVRVSGWFVPLTSLADQHYQLVASSSLGRQVLEQDIKRPDVLRSLFSSVEEIPRRYQSGECGFSLQLPISWMEAGLLLSAVSGQEQIDLVYISPQKLEHKWGKHFWQKALQKLRLGRV